MSNNESQIVRRATALEQEIFDTVRYFEIFALPVTATEIWRSLIVSAEGAGRRWGGQREQRLGEIERALKESLWLRARLSSCWGYYYLRRREGQAYVRARLARHVISQHKWKLARRAAGILARLPLVKMIGVAGSLALYNTRPSSDLDLFIVTAPRRIWTARLLLLGVAQLIGRRRKHWDRKAPDKVCLNHYITADNLVMTPAIHSIYTAVLYAHVMPVAGQGMFEQWRAANEAWIKGWLMFPAAPSLAGRQYVRWGVVSARLKKLADNILAEIAGDVLERWAERLQRRTIIKHDAPGRGGRIVLSATELAFHPDSKEPAIVHKFRQDPGQQQLRFTGA